MKHESDLYDEILLAVGSRRDARLWRANVGVARSMDLERVIRFGMPGMADLSGIVAGGFRLEIEVKRDAKSANRKSKTREAQDAFRNTILRFGGIHLDAVESGAHALQLLEAELCKKNSH